MKRTMSVSTSAVALFIVITAFSVGILWSLSDSISISDLAQFAVVDLVLLISVLVAHESASVDPLGDTVCFRCSLVLWFFLLISQDLFNRGGGTAESAIEGRFSVAAYGELSMWMLVFFVIILLSLRSPHYLAALSSGYQKWLTMFCLFCSASVAYAPTLFFSGAWAFKLMLITLVLGMCARFARGEQDLTAFIRATFWACTFLVCSAIYDAIVDPAGGFENGRLGRSPTSLSVIAGVLLSLSLTLRSFTQSFWASFFAIVSAVVMILGGGKAGIVGGIVGATMIYGLKKQIGSAIGLLSALICLGLILMLLSTGLNSYFHDYADAELAGNLTGRTGIWEAAIPAIRNRLLFGHGYMASRFVSFEIGSKGFGLWEADHMHNAFLDVLYNNGLLGFALIVTMHAIIIILLLSVIRATRTRPDQDTLNGIAIAGLAIYANLLINAFFNAIIGGRPSTLNMLFMGVFVLAHTMHRLQRAAERSITLPADYCSESRRLRQLLIEP